MEEVENRWLSEKIRYPSIYLFVTRLTWVLGDGAEVRERAIDSRDYTAPCSLDRSFLHSVLFESLLTAAEHRVLPSSVKEEHIVAPFFAREADVWYNDLIIFSQIARACRRRR